MRKRELIERCERLEEHVRTRRLATAEELAEYRPARRGAPLLRWVFFYAQLVRFCGRIEAQELPRTAADAVVLDALQASPRDVRLGPDRVVQVYPKSFEALLNFHARDRQLVWLTTRYTALRDNQNGADAMALLERVAAEIAYASHVLAWAATHEGVGLPFDPKADDRPEPPDQIRTLEPFALFQIHQAFVEINTAQLQALEALVDPGAGDEGGRPSWSVFFGSLAMRLRTDPKKLMRDHALVQLLAMVKLAAPPAVDDEAVA